MAIQTETIQVSGVRCERCVKPPRGRLGGLDGLEAANANLMGEVTLSWDDERTDREAILARLARARLPRARPPSSTARSETGIPLLPGSLQPSETRC